MTVNRFYFGGTVVELWDRSTRIMLPGGKTVLGIPEDTDAYRQTAREHGYGDDIGLLCKEHELTHVSLCHWLGIPSPTLYAVADGQAWQPIHGHEEAAVLAVQRFARAAGVDLMQRARKRSP